MTILHVCRLMAAGRSEGRKEGTQLVARAGTSFSTSLRSITKEGRSENRQNHSSLSMARLVFLHVTKAPSWRCQTLWNQTRTSYYRYSLTTEGWSPASLQKLDKSFIYLFNLIFFRERAQVSEGEGEKRGSPKAGLMFPGARLQLLIRTLNLRWGLAQVLLVPLGAPPPLRHPDFLFIW